MITPKQSLDIRHYLELPHVKEALKRNDLYSASKYLEASDIDFEAFIEFLELAGIDVENYL